MSWVTEICARRNDPNQTAGVAENALAPNELAWRQCAYEAVRAYAEEHPSLGALHAAMTTCG